MEGVGELNSVFLNAFDSNFNGNFEGNQTECELSCNVNNACQGYVWYQNEMIGVILSPILVEWEKQILLLRVIRN